ncbi:BamA/OMP85 family outer membrane protein [Salinibacter grassmerensis]|uniref:BamA/OMP85 family outer membrane protein n=1 Tax=Salinibacter grassmerensis TaxID=3040353 RepID=UPI0021E92FF0|nr:BamA/TamA family outer membrane protein [Salinibacter grassmerensis]
MIQNLTVSSHRRHVIYPTVGTVLLVLGGLLCIGGQRAVRAQSSVSSPDTRVEQWRLVLDGERVEWPDTVATASPNRVRAVGQRVLRHLRRTGHYYATLDSVSVDTSSAGPDVRFYARRGPRVRVGALRLRGDSAVPAPELRMLMETEEGAPLRPGQLEADIQRLLDRYEEAGRPLAQIRVVETTPSAAGTATIRVTLQIDEGPALWLRRVEASNDARATPELLAYLAGLEKDESLRGYDPDAIQRRLREHDLFRTVGAPQLRVANDGGAVLRIPIEEAPPGAFDAVLGYLPPSPTRNSGQLVGSGHLVLKHLFGGGRRAEFALDRRPGQASVVDVSVADPYLFGRPVRVSGRFRGEQRDSTYGERIYELEGGYRLGNGLELTATLSREAVRPGPAGTQVRGPRQSIPRATTLFYGVGVRYRQLDRSRNPRRGVSLNVQLSQGRKERQFRRVVASGDTTQGSDSFRQERLQGRVRMYLPLFDRQVVVAGGDGSVLLSRDYDRSDLFRLGGATSLRGYDEDRFVGNIAARGLVEYRLQLDRASYAHAFFDLGYVVRPELGATTATRGWHPGYGLGMRLQTALGRISASYALNPQVQSPANGRVHLGLSVGL